MVGQGKLWRGCGICENVGNFSTLLSSSCTRVVQRVWDSVETSCGSHLSDSTTGVICDSLENSIMDIVQRMCVTVLRFCSVPSV